MPVRVKLKRQPARELSPDRRNYGLTSLPQIGEGERFRDMIKKLSKSVLLPTSHQLHPPVIVRHGSC